MSGTDIVYSLSICHLDDPEGTQIYLSLLWILHDYPCCKFKTGDGRTWVAMFIEFPLEMALNLLYGY